MRTDLGYRAGRHALTLPASYAVALRAEMDGLKADAAKRRTYGDDFRLKDLLEESLAWVRRQIRKSESELRTERARQKRRAARGFGPYPWEAPALARIESNLRVERAHRDELVEGLREMTAQDRAHRRFLDGLRADLERLDAERAAGRS